MFSLKDLKEKISKKNAVETTEEDSSSEKTSIYADKPSKFKIKIVENDILYFIDYKVKEHNKANPNKEIEASDVVNAIVEKALLENALFNQFTKTYEDLKEESLGVRTALYQVHYYYNNTVPLAKENKYLKAEVKSVKEENIKQSKEIEELRFKLDSIRKVF